MVVVVAEMVEARAEVWQKWKYKGTEIAAQEEEEFEEDVQSRVPAVSFKVVLRSRLQGASLG